MLRKWKRIAGIYFQDEALRCGATTRCAGIGKPNLNDNLNEKLADVEIKLDIGLCHGCLIELGGLESSQRDLIGVCTNPDHEQD